MINEKIVMDLVKNNRPRFIEPGNYIGRIVNVQSKENQKGTTWLSICCEIDDVGRIYAGYYFTDKAYKRAFRELTLLAKEFDMEIDLDDFRRGNIDYLCNLFNQLCGEYVAITISGDVGNYNYKINKVE